MTKTRIHLAHIGLLDSVPLLVAREQGYFLDEGLDVELSCELGLATIAGKLAEQKLDGACLPAPLPVLLSLGADVPRVSMDVAAICAWQGMAVVRRAGKGKSLSPKVGVMTPGTSARMLLHKLSQPGISIAMTEPTLMPMAASQLVDFLREGILDGFCAADPLPAIARCILDAELVADSAEMYPAHPGSVVALRTEKVDTDVSAFTALTRAIHRGLEFCSQTSNRSAIFDLLFQLPPYIDLAEQARKHVKTKVLSREGGWISTRFDVPHDRNSLSPSSELFPENSCRGLLGAGSKSIDIKGEVGRAFKKRENLQVVMPVAKT